MAKKKEANKFADEKERILLLKKLANTIACWPVRDCLEDLHCAGKINQKEMGALMKEIKNEIMTTLMATIAVPVFKIDVPKVLLGDLLQLRVEQEWRDHGEVPGEWDRFDESLKDLREYDRTGDIELLRPKEKRIKKNEG